ncbi:acyltransferase [Lentisphaerota bacterium WC36G]|nr:acyltransferase [Lentisphaerae bacterium WC36]
MVTNNSFYSYAELKAMGFKKFGKSVLVSRNAKFYGINKIELGDNVRIDDFCILSGNIKIGSHIHISAGVYIFAGNSLVELEDFVTVSSRTSIYAISDNYLGDVLTNSCIDDEFKDIITQKVTLKMFSIVGSGSTILPGIVVETGAAVGANSLVTKSIPEWQIYAGSPAKKIKNRSKKMLELKNKFLEKFEEREKND